MDAEIRESNKKNNIKIGEILQLIFFILFTFTPIWRIPTFIRVFNNKKKLIIEIIKSFLLCIASLFLLILLNPLDIKNIKSLVAIFKSLDMNNYKVILNNSRDPFKDYFSMYELKKLIGHNIDYTISVNLYLKEMENLIMKGVIVSLDRKFSDVMSDDYHTFLVMATDILKGEDSNE